METLTGRFETAPDDKYGTVFFDTGFTVGVVSNYSTGALRVSNILSAPTLAKGWKMLGWTVTARMALVRVPGNTPMSPANYFVRPGDLWVGLAVNRGVSNVGGKVTPDNIPNSWLVAPDVTVQLPSDLSTFDKVWDGKTDSLRTTTWSLANNNHISPDDCSIIAKTYLFSVPQIAGPGAQLQMVAILTPGIYGMTTNILFGFPAIVLQSMEYSVLYERIK